MSTSAKVAAAARLIKRDVLNGAFAPDAPLRIPALVERYGVSATPLREALSRLAEQGFVASSANRGWRVAGVSLDEVEDLGRARLLVETELLCDSIATGDIEWEAGLVAAHHRLGQVAPPREADGIGARQRWIAAHDAFHAALIAGSASHWLRRFRDQLCEQLERHHQAILFAPQTFGALPGPQTGALLAEALSLPPHTALMQAALARDPDRATAQLRQHLQTTLRAYRSLGQITTTTTRPTTVQGESRA